MRLKWTRTALANLSDLAEYIAQDKPRAAVDVVERIVTAIDSLKEYPAIGRPGRVANTRELLVPETSYIVPYRVRGKRLEILRIIHASRRWPDDF